MLQLQIVATVFSSLGAIGVLIHTFTFLGETCCQDATATLFLLLLFAPLEAFWIHQVTGAVGVTLVSTPVKLLAGSVTNEKRIS